MWKWLKVSSIALFCRKALSLFSEAKKDVMYDLLKREDIDWRAFNYQVAKEIHTRHKVSDSALNVFVLDDSIKTRRGKKMEGVSRHFDPASGKPVMGHQVLTLGLATEEVFMPLD